MHFSQPFDVSVVSQGADKLITIGLDSGQVRFGRLGDDLVIQSEEGDQAIVENFYDESFDNSSIFFVFEDGVQMQAGEFELAWYEQGEPEPEDGSGIGEYRDGAGGLLAGIDRLGTLGTFGWERESGTEREDYGLLYASDDGPPLAPAPINPLQPDPPSPPDPPTPPGPGSPYPYSARAVLHAQDAGGLNEAGLADYYVNARAIFDTSLLRAWVPGGSLPAVTYLGGDGANLVAMLPGADGSIKFTLNEQALAWFAEHTDQKYIELYYQVGINGQTYNMQVVIPIHGEFCSEDFGPLSRHADKENSALVHGEWHAGRCLEDSGTVYAITSTNMADEMTYDGRVENSTIHTGHGSGDWGADSVLLNCHAAASGGKNSEIIARGADSEIVVNGDRAGLGAILASDGGSNTLEASGANSSIIVNNAGAGGLGALAAAGSSVILDASGRDGSIGMSGATTLYAENGAEIRLTAGADITLRAANNGVTGEAGGGSSLNSAAGSILIEAGGSASQSVSQAAGAYGGDISLSAANGLVTVKAQNAETATAAGALDGQTVITAREVELTATGRDSAYALRSEAVGQDGGSKINAGKVTIFAETTTGELARPGSAAVYAAGAGGLKASNLIDTPDLKITSKGRGAADTVLAEAGGSNILNAENARISLETNPGWTTDLGEFNKQTWDFSSRIVSAENGGSNTITGRELEIKGTVRASTPSDNEYEAAGINGANTVNVSIRGLNADKGTNTLNLAGDFRLLLETEGPPAYRTVSQEDGKTITNSVTADTKATGIYASGAGGLNDLTVKGAMLLEAHGSYGATGIQSVSRGENKIEITEGAILDVKTPYGTANGLVASSSSSNELTAKYLDLSVYGRNESHGITAEGGANTVNLTGKDKDGMAMSVVVDDELVYNLEGDPASGTAGMYVRMGSNTVNNHGGGNILIAAGFEKDADGNLQRGERVDVSHGVYSGAANTINAGGAEVDIQVAGGRFATGMSGTYYAGVAALNDASRLNINVNSVSNGGNVHYHFKDGTYGLFANQQGKVLVQDVDEVIINLKNYGAPGTECSRFTAGIGSFEGSEILVNSNAAKDNTIRLNVEGDSRIVTGQWLATALSGAVNRNQVGGEKTTLVRYDITGKGEQDVTDFNNPYAKHTVSGMYGDFYSQSGGPVSIQENVLRGREVLFNITGEKLSHAAGMWANISSQNKLYADDLTMNVNTTGTTDAHGLAAEVYEVTVGGSGFNTVTADKAKISAEASGSGDAYGMKAYSHGPLGDAYGTPGGSGNLITSKGAIELTITAKAASGLAYAMFAATPNGSAEYDINNWNKIVGNSTAGTSDRITLNGDLYADSVSKNTISTGAGADYVRINGDCNGKNSINTGDGDDSIVLNGRISGLMLDAGDGEHDVLILVAESLTQFENYYQTWLSGLNFTAINVEHIRLAGVTPDQVPWLQSLLSGTGIDLEVQTEPFVAAARLMEELAAAQPEAEEREVNEALSFGTEAAECSPQLLDLVAGLDDEVPARGDGWEQIQLISSYAFNPGIASSTNAWLAELDFDDAGCGGGLDLLLPEPLQPCLPVGGQVGDYAGQAATPGVDGSSIPFVSGDSPALEIPAEHYTGDDTQAEILLMQQGVL